MGAARQAARRRWGAAGGAIAVLCSLPALIGALPVSAPRLEPAALRDRILASGASGYSGFAESHGTLGLPDLPALGAVAALLGERTQLRVWHASPDRWRVDVLTATGERDTYGAGSGTLSWDYERNTLIRLVGEPDLRLPRAADLVPAELGRRVLGGAAAGELSALGPRRVAGVEAAGLRLTPADPDTTVAHVDVWADPASGLPVEVRVTGRDSGSPGIVTRFLDLEIGPVPGSAVTPPDPSGAQRVTASAPEVNDYIDRYAGTSLPSRLAGHARSDLAAAGSRALGTYGAGFASFAVAALPDRLGFRAYDVAQRAEADEIEVGSARAVVLRTPLLTLVVVEPSSGRRDGFLLAGTVRSALLTRAAGELVGSGPADTAGREGAGA
jgi:hypothetical protein